MLVLDPRTTLLFKNPDNESGTINCRLAGPEGTPHWQSCLWQIQPRKVGLAEFTLTHTQYRRVVTTLSSTTPSAQVG